jgi:hypothetical protein
MMKIFFLIFLFSISSCASPRSDSHRDFSPPTKELSRNPSCIPTSNSGDLAQVDIKIEENPSKVGVALNTESKNEEVFHKADISFPAEFETSSKLWELISDNDGIKTFRETDPAGDIVSFRGEALLHASIEKLAAVLNTPELRKEWVDSLADTHTIEKKVWSTG